MVMMEMILLLLNNANITGNVTVDGGDYLILLNLKLVNSA